MLDGVTYDHTLDTILLQQSITCISMLYVLQDLFESVYGLGVVAAGRHYILLGKMFTAASTIGECAKAHQRTVLRILPSLVE